MSGPIDIAAIVDMLTGAIEALCITLLPAGVKEGAEYRVGSVAGEPGRSMAVHLHGPRAGVWCDFGGLPSDRGDALDLVAKVKFNGDKRQALAWSRAWLGLDAIDPASFAERRRQIAEKKARAVDVDKKTRGWAQAMFIRAQPKIADTLAERYFLGRFIDWRALGRMPASLRFAAELAHPETGELVPAIIAAITGPAGDTIAVHRTYLERLPDGRVVKLRGVKDAKLTLGTYAGGAIRLWRGATGKPLRDAVSGEWAMIGEGIEDTATGIGARPDLRAFASVSGSNIVILPPAITGVILLAQNEDNAAAEAAFERVVAAYQKQGKRVKVARVDRAQGKDVNELAQRALAGG